MENCCTQTPSRALTTLSRGWGPRSYQPTEMRSSWSGQTSHLLPVSSPPGESPGVKPGLAPSHIVLIVVAIFAVVTGAAALLIVRYQRMTGKYNFKTQSDDFSYQVFHD